MGHIPKAVVPKVGLRTELWSQEDFNWKKKHVDPGFDLKQDLTLILSQLM